MVLLIACVNFGGLLMARIVTRRREMGRKLVERSSVAVRPP